MSENSLYEEIDESVQKYFNRQDNDHSFCEPFWLLEEFDSIWLAINVTGGEQAKARAIRALALAYEADCEFREEIVATRLPQIMLNTLTSLKGVHSLTNDTDKLAIIDCMCSILTYLAKHEPLLSNDLRIKTINMCLFLFTRYTAKCGEKLLPPIERMLLLLPPPIVDKCANNLSKFLKLCSTLLNDRVHYEFELYWIIATIVQSSIVVDPATYNALFEVSKHFLTGRLRQPERQCVLYLTLSLIEICHEPLLGEEGSDALILITRLAAMEFQWLLSQQHQSAGDATNYRNVAFIKLTIQYFTNFLIDSVVSDPAVLSGSAWKTAHSTLYEVAVEIAMCLDENCTLPPSVNIALIRLLSRIMLEEANVLIDVFTSLANVLSLAADLDPNLIPELLYPLESLSESAASLSHLKPEVQCLRKPLLNSLGKYFSSSNQDLSQLDMLLHSIYLINATPPNSSHDMEKLFALFPWNKITCSFCEVNLDMSYITPRIIAMGFPAKSFEGIYRNNADEVKKHLDRKHPHLYLIYNLCEEMNRQYDPKMFDNRVEECIQFPDHHPPRLRAIENFCKSVEEWFSGDQRRVVAVHCKAGKGRTGVMICAYLVHSDFCANATEALHLYAQKRTKNNKGVTIPSQIRYVYYYSFLHFNQIKYHEVGVLMHRIRMQWFTPAEQVFDNPPLPTTIHYEIIAFPPDRLTRESTGSDRQNSPAVKLRTGSHEIDNKQRSNGIVFIEMGDPVLLEGDIKIIISKQSAVSLKHEEIFDFSFNTFFAYCEDFQKSEDEKIQIGTKKTIGKRQQQPNECPCINCNAYESPFVMKFPKKNLDRIQKDAYCDSFEVALILEKSEKIEADSNDWTRFEVVKAPSELNSGTENNVDSDEDDY